MGDSGGTILNSIEFLDLGEVQEEKRIIKGLEPSIQSGGNIITYNEISKTIEHIIKLGMIYKNIYNDNRKDILFPILHTEEEKQQFVDDINKNPRKKDNYDRLINDIKKMKLDEDPFKITFVSLNIRPIKFTNFDTNYFFRELVEYNTQIWMLIYKNYSNGWKNYKFKEIEGINPAIPSSSYVWRKHVFHIYNWLAGYKKQLFSAEEEQKIMLFVYLRNYQLIIINSIYNIIETFYNKKMITRDTIIKLYEKLKIAIDNENLRFANFKIKGVSVIEEIKKDPKIKYQYLNFIEYIEIYKKLIIKKFREIEQYSKYNIFVIEYIRNYLLIRNGIYYKTKLLIGNFYNNIEDADKEHIDAINKINEIIDKIDEFLSLLNKINSTKEIIDIHTQAEKTKDIGYVLFGVGDINEYVEELKKMFFLTNLFVDKGIETIYIDLKKNIDEKKTDDIIYCTPIIESPSYKLPKHTRFCDLVEKFITYNKNKTKIIGKIGSYDAFIDTCEKFEASNYLTLNSPISFFITSYWSDLINNYMTTKAIIKYNYVLLFLNKDFVSQDVSRRVDNSYTNIDNLMSNKKYLGYLKLYTYPEIVKPEGWQRTYEEHPQIKIGTKPVVNIILVFFNNYCFEFYNIYGSQIRQGYVYSSNFLSTQEISILTSGQDEGKRAYLDTSNKTDEKNFHLYWMDPFKKNEESKQIEKSFPEVTRVFHSQQKYSSEFLETDIQKKITELIETKDSIYNILKKLKEWMNTQQIKEIKTREEIDEEKFFKTLELRPQQQTIKSGGYNTTYILNKINYNYLKKHILIYNNINEE